MAQQDKLNGQQENTRPHLQALCTARPATHMGQVIWAWREIEAALANGMRLREVWEAAKLDGLDIPYPQFRVYVSRARRRLSRSSRVPSPETSVAVQEGAAEIRPVDFEVTQ